MTTTPSLLLAYYGDDFTGSTDVMESLARSGVPIALFVEPPTPERLSRFPGLRAIGVAGVSRSLSPEAMRRELVPVFERFKALGVPLAHYKVCSTFDSSPQIGSIGCAIEVGQEVFGSSFVPLVVGAPSLGRYVAFGNLFARSGLDSEPFRLDRHPTMRRHPVTPMDESDLRLHLARQTSRSIALFDVLQLDKEREAARQSFAALLSAGPDVVLFDTLYEPHLAALGDLIWERVSPQKTLFAVGSSGVEYSLTAFWREHGELPEPPVFTARQEAQIVVVSGSCSPVTQRQIAWAMEHGFEEVALDTPQLLDEHNGEGEIERAVCAAQEVLRRGHSPILHTALGPNDPRLEPTRAKLQAQNASSSEVLGRALGRVLSAVWQSSGLARAAITGGDTSGFVARELGIEAMEMAAPITPGAPLCRIASPGHALNGREIVFKGGQVGKPDFFQSVLRGAS